MPSSNLYYHFAQIHHPILYPVGDCYLLASIDGNWSDEGGYTHHSYWRYCYCFVYAFCGSMCRPAQDPLCCSIVVTDHFHSPGADGSACFPLWWGTAAGLRKGGRGYRTAHHCCFGHGRQWPIGFGVALVLCLLYWLGDDCHCRLCVWRWKEWQGSCLRSTFP